MKRLLQPVLVFLLMMTSACSKEEEPTYPPVIESPFVDCDSAAADQLQTVSRVGVTITDRDRDLLTGSIQASVNGLPIELRDDEGDNVFTWSPAEDADPMVCEQTITLIVRASDAEGNQTRELLRIQP